GGPGRRVLGPPRSVRRRGCRAEGGAPARVVAEQARLHGKRTPALAVLELSRHPADRLLGGRVACWVAEALPTSDQCLMADVDLAIVRQRSRRVGSKKVTTSASECLDHCCHAGAIVTGDGNKRLETARMTSDPALAVEFRKAAEY